MKKDINEILYYDIIENSGIGDVQLGMTMDNFSELYDIKNNLLRIPLDGIKEYNAYYMFNDSVCLDFDRNKKLYSIALSGNFKGKFMGKIEVGSRFGDLRALRKDMQYELDTNSLYLGTGYKFRFLLEPHIEQTYGLDVSDYYSGKIDDWYISSIDIEKWERDGFHPNDSIWCSWTNKDRSPNMWGKPDEEWVEPEEKYLKTRYSYP